MPHVPASAIPHGLSACVEQLPEFAEWLITPFTRGPLVGTSMAQRPMEPISHHINWRLDRQLPLRHSDQLCPSTGHQRTAMSLCPNLWNRVLHLLQHLPVARHLHSMQRPPMATRSTSISCQNARNTSLSLLAPMFHLTGPPRIGMCLSSTSWSQGSPLPTPPWPNHMCPSMGPQRTRSAYLLSL